MEYEFCSAMLKKEGATYVDVNGAWIELTPGALSGLGLREGKRGQFLPKKTFDAFLAGARFMMNKGH